ncbi:retinol dehydrogenase 12-like [Lutzomyia longipalpis]|uniref:retinol dehydrogenase 12-like n=1 Tax=Lutzomyia longipalpis TaxID=7200 RepID=UPI0024843573|nr:retinol dehydrogenase 12-like [Lutzomyia longipalpis]
MLNQITKTISLPFCIIWSIIVGTLKRSFAPLRTYVQGGQFRKSHVQLEGKVAVITGGPSALEIAVDLARREARVIIGVKNPKDDAEKILEIIADRTGSTNVHIEELNLASFDSVRGFVKKFREKEERLDILINCSNTAPFGKTPEGIKWAMMDNFYGHFLLTLNLLDVLKKSSPSRIVIQTSKLHGHSMEFWNKLQWWNLKDLCHFSGYFMSSLSNVIFTQLLAKKLTKTGITVNCYHEGYTAQRLLPQCLLRFLNPTFLEFFFKTPRSAAQTAICLAVDPDLAEVSGKFFSDCKEMEVSKKANNTDAAKFIWQNALQVTSTSIEDLEITKKFPEIKD